MCKVAALIAAAGSGKRIGGDSPKQYLKIADKPVLIYTLEKFYHCNSVDEIILIVHCNKVTYVKNLLKKWQIQKVTSVIAGGKERQDSIRQGLAVLSDETELVIVHDGVRPFVSVKKIDEAIQAGRDFGAAVLAVPEKNTIKHINDRWVEKTLNRDNLWEVQTPQVFRADWLKESYIHAGKNHIEATDDAVLVEQLGHRIRLVQGEETNIKITSPVDLKIAETFAKNGY